ncbi:unnamed protein product [Sphagnum jensenii]|uniref:Uncharacterized protein n=1 Tax=Sphagnum jensenii TaxID=128206 RepID=A0ABP0W6I2_9BRYO
MSNSLTCFMGDTPPGPPSTGSAKYPPKFLRLVRGVRNIHLSFFDSRGAPHMRVKARFVILGQSTVVVGFMGLDAGE